MAEDAQIITVRLTPIPPDTVRAGKEEVEPFVETALRNAGREDLLSKDQLQVRVEKTFPVDAVIVVVFTLGSNIALEIFKSVVLPALKRKFQVEEQPKDQADKK